MDIPDKQPSETFSVEEGYVIGTVFFLELWPLLEPKITEKEEWTGTYSLFFLIVCSGGECSAEWNEAVERAMHIPKENQKTLRLTVSEIFSCALEFCKLHNERYENNISYAVNLLEAMQKNPESYRVEWNIWEKIIKDTKTKHIDIEEFDWSAELPTWPTQKIQEDFKGK